MDSERTNVQNFQNLKFAQHNCRKSINVMQSILKHVKTNSLNLMLIQKSWIQNDENHNNMTISHPNFTCLIPRIKKYKSRVATFVNKCRKELKCTSKIDLINDLDIQILNIFINDLKNVKIVNIYNKKNQNPDSQTRTTDRLLNITIGKSILTYGNFNAHHK